MPLELLGPLCCGLTTGAGAVLNVLRPEVGSSIVIFGTGAVGCSALLAAVDIGTFLTQSPTISGVIEGDAVPQSFIPLLVELYEAGRFPAHPANVALPCQRCGCCNSRIVDEPGRRCA